MAGSGLDDELRREFGQLLARHNRKVLGQCRRLLGDSQRAEELAQETFLVAQRRIGSFEGRSSFSTWMCGIARGLCFNELRRAREELTPDGELEAEAPELSVVRTLSRAEREDFVWRCARAVLDDLEQEVAHLRYVEQLPVKRITEILDIETSSGARGKLQNITRKLAPEMRRQLGELGHGTSFLRTDP